MELLWLEADQIVAMIDYPPLHSPEALEEYYQAFCAGAPKVSPIPVLGTDPVLAAFRRRRVRFARYRHRLQAFLDSHPAATYFMLGGKHRAAAAVLAGKLIPCVHITDDAAFMELNAPGSGIKLHGDYTTVPTDMTSIEEELRILEAHFSTHRRFWTVEEKVRAMIASGDIPEAMKRDACGKRTSKGTQAPRRTMATRARHSTHEDGDRREAGWVSAQRAQASGRCNRERTTRRNKEASVPSCSLW